MALKTLKVCCKNVGVERKSQNRNYWHVIHDNPYLHSASLPLPKTKILDETLLRLHCCDICTWL